MRCICTHAYERAVYVVCVVYVRMRMRELYTLYALYMYNACERAVYVVCVVYVRMRMRESV